MNGRSLLALGALLMLAGVTLMAVSMGRGDSSAGVLLIVPFFITTSPLGALGGLLLMGGLLLAFLGWAAGCGELVLTGSGEPEEWCDGPRKRTSRGGGDRTGGAPATKGRHSDTMVGGGQGDQDGKGPTMRGGAVVFLGPFPVVAGSDPAMARTLMVAGAVVMALAIVYVLLVLML